jgi:hypothetical protein
MEEKTKAQDINQKLDEINKNLKILNDSNKFKEVTIRGLVNGVSTGVGATIGLAIIIFLISRLLSQFSYLPLIDQFLKDTKLDKIIEYQVQQIDQIEQTDNKDITDNVELKYLY